MGRLTQRRPVLRVDGDRTTTRPDTLVAEEPLEIRIDGRAVTVTMRTPGDDLDLALGFLVTEGVIGAADDVRAATTCADNVIDVTLADGAAAPDLSIERNFYTTSSCGLCGKASIDAIRTRTRWPVDTDRATLGHDELAGLPDRLRAAQRIFDRTGGLHAAGLFDAATGELLVVREDVGRHNAVDKLVGWAFTAGRLPLHATALLVSGRASFELVQKALMAGIPILAAVSAPSSLAADLAAEVGLTLVGFLRGPAYNVYARPDRITSPAR